MSVSTSSFSVLIAGFGDIGHRIADALDQRATHYQLALDLYAIRRQQEAHPLVKIIQWDMTQPIDTELPNVDYVIFCVSADQLTETGYQRSYVDGQISLIKAIKDQGIPVKHYFFCSSTSVYGQKEHEWVNEDSLTEPTRFTGKMMLKAEGVANTAPCPVTSIRATGLYGPGRTRMVSQVLSGKVAAVEPLCYSNQIHVDDLAALYAHLIVEHHRNTLELSPLYLACDDTPVAIHEVQEWMAKVAGVEIKERVPAGRTGSKRISNARMKATGFKLTYPGYRDGMPELLRELLSDNH